MSKNIVYIGTSHVREITDANWTAIGIPGEPTRRWEKANSYEQLVGDTAATYLLAQGEFVDETGLSFAAVVNDTYNNKRLEQRMKKNTAATVGDWRTFNIALGRRTAEPVDILVISDSIGEGWCCNAGPSPMSTTYPRGERDQQGWVGRMRRLLQLAFNPDGRGGIWVPAGAGWWGQSPWKFSANGSDLEVNDGIALRAREQYVSNSNPATLTAPNCDGMTLLWEKMNIFGGCEMRVSVDGAQQTQLATFDGALPAFGTEVYQYQWSGTRGDHLFSIAAIANGGSNTLFRWTGAFFHDGDMASGVRVWNGAHFGYAGSHWVTNSARAWSAISKGFIKPRLVIYALGTNDTPANYGADAASVIASINAACVTAGQKRPALAILTPPANASTPNTSRETTRAASYDLAATMNGDVWEWNELEGSVAIADGNDPYSFTYDISSVKDNTHPGGAGHRMLGDFVASRILANVTPIVATEQNHLTIHSGRRNVKVVAASSTAQTLNCSEYQDFNVTMTGNCTFTLAGAVAGLHCTIELTLKQDGTGSRTVTFSPTVKWASGTAFVASTAANAIDRVFLETNDGGTTWIGTFSKGFA